MKNTNLKNICLILFAATGLLNTSLAFSQQDNFPNKPINYIVPYPPGGPTDVAGRILAEVIGKKLNQNIIIENKSGASGSIGIVQLIRSKPDGYNIAALGAPSLTAPFMLEKAPYDLTNDVFPVGVAYITPLVIVVNPRKTPEIKDMKSFAEAAKKLPQGMNYTTAGVGSTAHLAMELIKKDMGVQMTHVPYRGSAPGVTALLAGDIPLMYSDLVAVLPHIKAGNLRTIAVNTENRVEEMPETPTLAEQGIQASKAFSWAGILAPKDTPENVIQKLSQALESVLKDANVQTRLKAVGAYPYYKNPQETKKLIAQDSKTWSEVIKANNLKQSN